MIRGYDAWKLATPYDGECPECGSNRFNEECETCVAARDYAEGLADYLYEKRRDEMMEDKLK